MKRCEVITRQSIVLGEILKNICELKKLINIDKLSPEQAFVIGKIFANEDEWEYLERVLVSTED